MSRLNTIGWALGESVEGRLKKDRAYTLETNDTLAGDNASPLPGGDVAAVGFHLPPSCGELTIEMGCAFRQAMADQLDEEDKLSFARR